MTEEQSRKLDALYRFWMEPVGPKQATRAEMIDDALNALRAGKLGARGILWLSGAVIAIAGVLSILKGGGS